MRDIGRSRPKAQFDQRAERRLKAQRRREREFSEAQEHLNDVTEEINGHWDRIPD